MRAVQPRPPASEPRARPGDGERAPGELRTRRRWRRIDLAIFLIVFGVLAAARLALAPLLERRVNRLLDRHADYAGTIGDVDVNLWRGAYVVRDVVLYKRSGEQLEPFLAAKSVDFSMQWPALLHGALVGEVAFIEPRLNFVLAPTDEASQTEIDRRWQDTVLALFPFRIDQVLVHHGTIRFRDLRKEPVVDVDLSEVQGRIRNLTNVREPETEEGVDESLVATVEATGRPLREGTFWLDMRLDPFATRPTFDLDAALQGLDLVRVNDLLRAYGNLDVERGEFDVFLELAASQGRVTGYVKPFLRDLDVVAFREIDDPGDALQALWEAIAGGTAKALTNQGSGQLATRIPLEGTIGETQTDVFATVGNLLVNAFVRALIPRAEDTVDLADAKEEQTDDESKAAEEEESERTRDRVTLREKRDR